MHITAFTITAVAVGLLVFFASLVRIEQSKGRRILVENIRYRLDVLLTTLTQRIVTASTRLIRRVITLSWYYSLHALLMVCLRFIAAVYTSIEHILIQNRSKAKAIRRELRKTHLTEIADHQSQTTLSEKDKKKLKAKSLAGK